MISSKARDSKNFVAMMQFIDWLWYSDAGQEFAKWGVEGTTYTKDASGKRTLAAGRRLRRAQPEGHQAPAEGLRLLQRRLRLRRQSTDLLQSIFSEEELEFQKAMDARKTLRCRPPYPLTDEEREQATLWETPLKDYVNQQTLQFVLGQRPLSEWDAYVTELKGKNMDAYIELVNKAHERFVKSRK